MSIETQNTLQTAVTSAVQTAQSLTSSVSSDATVQAGQTFASALATAQNQVSDTAIAKFYDIYQQSQITGVPTSKFNKALADIGFKPDQVNDAVAMMQSRGHNTDQPTIGAILKYGSEPSAVGNQTYMKQGAESPKFATFVSASATGESVKSVAINAQADMSTLNAQTGGLIGDATNYFSAAVNLTNQLGSAQISGLTIDQLAAQLAQQNQASAMMQTQDYLAMRQLMAG